MGSILRRATEPKPPPAAAVEPVETPAAGAQGVAPAAGQVFAAPAKAGGIGSQDDFVKGIVVGAGLVLLGVVVGGIFGRRRP